MFVFDLTRQSSEDPRQALSASQEQDLQPDDMADEYVPEGHSRQVGEPSNEKRPAGHMSHEVAPADEYVPFWQFLHELDDMAEE